MNTNFLRLFNEDGEWTGNKDRTILVDGEEHNLDDYAKQHGIELPSDKKPKKTVNTKEEESYADMEQSHLEGDSKES